MGVTFEEGEAKLGSLISWCSQHVTDINRNEATTRLQLIDRLFFECLGWDREDCTTEEHLDGKYIDYSFKCPQCMLIVEAKREGSYFELPASSDRVKREIRFFLQYSKDMAEAIRQAVTYCQSHGTPFGAVCNGHQLIAFVATRTDGHPPLQGVALAFDSLEQLQKEFFLAWQCFSKPGVQARTLAFELQDRPTAPPPEKLSAHIPGYPGYKRRNALQTDLQILSELFIEDVARHGPNGDERDFLAQTYCHSGALSQYAAVSKDILRARYSTLFQKASGSPSLGPATTRKGPSPELLAKSLSRRPILLIGDRGVGKSTFIKYLSLVDAEDIFSEALVCYIDFGSQPALAQASYDYIADQIKDQMWVKYEVDIYDANFVRGVLHGDLERFDRSVMGDVRRAAPDMFELKRVEYIQERLANKDDYLKRCLDHLSKGRKKQIIIFLDNVDQRPADFQETVFLAGHSMAENWPVTVFISIRPETFYKSRISGTLSAYHPRAFTIAPPRVDEVIAKRLDYGVQLIGSGIQLGFQETIKVSSENLKDYLQVLSYSFRNNKYLMEFLDNMCGGNIRLALDYVRVFIGSGHVDTQKILNIYRGTGAYLVPLHEFLRAITYVDHEDYSPTASEIVNVFDVTTPDGREHFLSPVLLTQLDRWSEHSSSEGFVNLSEIYAYLQSLGFTPQQVGAALDRLTTRNLIESATKSREAGSLTDTASYFRITTIGAYYVKRLIRYFAYVDAVLVDTPIVDREIRRKLSVVDTLVDRLERASLFCDYLDSQWMGLSRNELAFDWASVRRALDQDIEYITGRISIREDVLP